MGDESIADVGVEVWISRAGLGGRGEGQSHEDFDAVIARRVEPDREVERVPER